MARFYRVGLWLGLLLALVLPGVSRASFPAAVTYSDWYSGGGQCQRPSALASIACLSALQYGGAEADYHDCQLISGGTGTSATGMCTYLTNTYTSGSQSVIRTASTAACPANSTGTSTCTCNAGFVESGNVCQAYGASSAKAVLDALNASGNSLAYTGTSYQLSACFNGYVMTGSGSALGIKAGVGTGEIYGPFTTTGATCTGSEVGGSESSCKAGEVEGTVNGLTVCAPAASVNTVSSVTAPPAGSASAPVSGIPDAPPTATQATKSTECVGGQCVTTTTYTNSGGTVVGTGTKTQSAATFCGENPGSPICKQSSYSAAACGSPPACSGDAIQCAIAAESFKTSCALTDTPSDVAAVLARKLSSGDVTAGLPGSSSVTIGPGSFDQTELFGTVGGLADRTIVVMGQSILIPFSDVNVWLERLGNVFLSVAFLVAASILFRGQSNV